MDLSLPRGTSDLKPEDAIKLNELIKLTETVFKSYGFYPLETPSLELTSTLTAKAYGEENTKGIFLIDGKQEGLRYDLTVPLARYVASNKDISLPFKRYQIGRVWRLDEPQRMREREFIQADIDIVGNTEIIAEAELISATFLILKNFGLDNFKIYLNSRELLSKILTVFKIEEKLQLDVMRILDKIDKIGLTETKSRIIAKGVDEKTAQELLDLLRSDKVNAEWLAVLKNRVPDSTSETEKLETLISLLKIYNIENVFLDPSLSRGMDYYTGIVWEFVAYEEDRRLPTIASGGRYDKLIGIYLNKEIPAVGSSIGITRLFSLLNKNNKKTYADVYVAYIGKESIEYALKIAIELRKKSIKVDMNMSERGISKQLDYANSLKIPYVAIIGDREKSENKVTLKNMITGEEQLLDTNSLINYIVGNVIK
ncbi:MAG: histidine--tRNA ligase [Candidatus Micrarchaeia archaeon]